MVRGLAANAGAFIAAVLFGASVVAVRVVVQGIAPLSLAVLRFSQGGLILFAFLLVGGRGLLHVERRDLLFIAVLGAIFFAFFPLTFNTGLRLTEASRGALMLATMPLWSALLAWAAGREQLVRRQVAGVLLTLSGVVMVMSERGLNWQVTASSMVGDSLMLVTAISGATYGILAKRALVRYHALTVTTYAMVLGTLFLLPAAVAEGLFQALSWVDAGAVALILFLGIFGGAVGYFLWNFALTQLTPTQVAVYVNLNPMVATILGATLLGEVLALVFATGFLAVLAGVLLVNWPKKKNLLDA